MGIIILVIIMMEWLVRGSLMNTLLGVMHRMKWELLTQILAITLRIELRLIILRLVTCHPWINPLTTWNIKDKNEINWSNKIVSTWTLPNKTKSRIWEKTSPRWVVTLTKLNTWSPNLSLWMNAFKRKRNYWRAYIIQRAI